MKTNSIQSSVKKSHNYLANLITIFNAIHNQLSTLPNFEQTVSIELDDIVCSISTDFELVQRQVRKQNQIKLFLETLQMVQQLHTKKSDARKADIIMHCVHVADILKNRIINQLYIKGQARTKIVDSIQRLKDNMIRWAQKQQPRTHQQTQRNRIKYNRKSIQRYTVKYIFNEETRPSSTNITRVNSVDNSKIRLNNIFTNKELLSCQKDSEQKIKKSSKISKMTKNSTTKVDSQNKQKEIDLDTQSRKRVGRKNRYAVKYSQKQYQTKLKNLLNYVSRTQVIKKHDDYSETSSQEDEYTQEQQSSSELQTVDCKINQDQHLKSIRTNNKNYSKRPQFYLNQNFNRNNENTIKNDNLCDFKQNHQKSQQEAHNKQKINQGTQKYKAGKYMPRRGIRNANIRLMRPSNTEKALANIKTITQKGKLANRIQRNQVLHLSMLRKQKQTNHSEYKNEIQKSLNNKFNNKANIVQPLINNQYTEVHNLQSKKMTDFYSVLSQMRLQFNKSPNQYLQDRSMFFHQQGLLWQQQKRKIDRIDQEKQSRSEIHSFDLKTSVSNLADQKLLKQGRKDMFNYGCRFFKQRIIEKISQVQLGPEKGQIMN